MDYQLLGFPWFTWVLFVLGVVYIGLILWFCQRRASESYIGNNPRICLFIIILTIVLIIGNVLTIILAI